MKKHGKTKQKGRGRNDYENHDDDDSDYDDDDDVPKVQATTVGQFPGLVATVLDWEFLAPKRKHCCNLENVESGYLKTQFHNPKKPRTNKKC